MTLSVATSITPEISCCKKQQDRVLTWVSFKWKKPVSVDQFSAERNTFASQLRMVWPDMPV
jgi:hypothetical protein